MQNQSIRSIISTIKKLLDCIECEKLSENTEWYFENYIDDQVILFCKEDNHSFDDVVQYFSEHYVTYTVPRFIVFTSYLMLCLKDKLEVPDPENDKTTLISISEEQKLKQCVEVCVSLSFMGTLLPGIGIPIERRSKLIGFVKRDQSRSVLENYNRLAFIVNVVTELVNSNTIFKDIVLCKHLGDYTSALFQLNFAPLLKPGCGSKDSSFTMSKELYERLITERGRFKQVLSQLQTSVNQTELLKEVILMFGYSLQSGKKYVWFTNACTKILNQTLNKPNGIEILLKAMCDEDFTSPLVWKKLDIVARILVTMKSSFDVVCPQILEMIQYSDELMAASDQLKLNHQFSIPTCKHLHLTDPEVFQQYILSRIVSPLDKLGDSSDATDLTTSVIVLDRLFSHVDGLPYQLLVKYTKRLFFIYVNVFESPLFTPAKVAVEKLLTTLFTMSGDSCEQLMNVCIFQEVGVTSERVEELDEDDVDELDEDDVEEDKQQKADVTSTNLLDDMLSFPSGSIQISSTGEIIFVPPARGTETVVDYEKFGRCVLSLMEKCRKQNKLFICLLNNYTREVFKDDIDRNVVNLSLLNNMVTKIQMESFISDTSEHILMLIQFLIKQSRRNEDSEFPYNTDALCTGLTLLSLLMGEHNKYCPNQCARIVPSLEALINENPNEEVVLLAKQCLEPIQACNVKNLKEAKKKDKSYEKAMSEARDPLLPVRAHGLSTLTRLILYGNAQAKANMSALLCLFMENLSDPDSYVYLAAVEGLGALAADHADTVVQILSQQFTSSTGQLETRLKLGEVLMKVARYLGEMLPNYKSYFLNAFLHGCKDEDHLMRTSCLSNLAEVCRLLGYRVGSILGEIFVCIRAIIISDPCPEPRRAAVMVTSYLLCALKEEALQVLEPILPELYRTLKYLYDKDPDDRTRLHAQLALEQLNEAVKTFLTPALPASFATLRL